VICALIGLATTGLAALVASPARDQFLLLMGIAFVVLGVVPGVRRRVTEQIGWAVALQSSIIMATVNGVRGRWDVWR
jgi:hypothetical protein